MAENQAARRLARKKEQEAKLDRRQELQRVMLKNRSLVRDIKEARKVRREDYELGPLAPRRDVGAKADTYGTLEPARLQGKNLSKKERLEMNPNSGWYVNIVKEDRVVLLEGQDKGKIGKITTVDRRRQECTVEGLNMV